MYAFTESDESLRRSSLGDSPCRRLTAREKLVRITKAALECDFHDGPLGFGKHSNASLSAQPPEVAPRGDAELPPTPIDQGVARDSGCRVSLLQAVRLGKMLFHVAHCQRHDSARLVPRTRLGVRAEEREADLVDDAPFNRRICSSSAMPAASSRA